MKDNQGQVVLKAPRMTEHATRFMQKKSEYKNSQQEQSLTMLQEVEVAVLEQKDSAVGEEDEKMAQPELKIEMPSLLPISID